MRYEILRQLESDWKDFAKPISRYQREIKTIQNNVTIGRGFLEKWGNIFGMTGSPMVVNLDHNASGSTDLKEMIERSKCTVNEMKTIVKSSAGNTSGYKMNEQSMLTFLTAGDPNFVGESKSLFMEAVDGRFGVKAEPVFWTDEKLRDIPSTTYQTARIIYNLGFDATHCMPQIGPDVSGSLQIAAEEMGNRGVVHVINMTHDGYNYSKKNYFKENAIDLIRKNATGVLETDVSIGRGNKRKVVISATGVIEPANRPNEILQSKKIYGDKAAIISIGIGPDQGAWPGSALYAGAQIEGVGRFIFKDDKGKLDSPENISKKTRACKRSALMSLAARYESKPYPFDSVERELGSFVFPINQRTEKELEMVYESRRHR